MTSEQYKALTVPFRSRPWCCRLIIITNKFTTYLVYILYAAYILYQLIGHDSRIAETIAVPAFFFVILSVYRDKVNAPRPYEVLDIQPIIQKSTKGHSFPSRHVFSAFVIASTISTQLLWLGILLFIIGVIICFIRVIGGVHFPKDVVAGIIIGIVSGFLGCYVMSML